jgi:lipoate-protein ligase A
MHKAPGGLIRTVFELKDNIITNLSISGDFFCYPSDAISMLEKALEGTLLSGIEDLIVNFYKDAEFEIPGITTDDWVKALNG